jgi:hypothetical protein
MMSLAHVAHIDTPGPELQSPPPLEFSVTRAAKLINPEFGRPQLAGGGLSCIPQDLQCRFDAVIRDQHSHTFGSALHAHANADNYRGYAGSLQIEPRQIRFH